MDRIPLASNRLEAVSGVAAVGIGPRDPELVAELDHLVLVVGDERR